MNYDMSGPHFTEERQQRWGVRFLSPSQRSPSPSRTARSGETSSSWRQDPDASVATTGSQGQLWRSASGPHVGLLYGG